MRCFKINIGKMFIYVSDHKLRKDNRDHSQGLQRRKLRRATERNCEGGGYCHICGASGVPLSVHHVIPQAVAQDLRWEPDNCLLLCGECHRRVHSNPFLQIDLIRKANEKMNKDLTKYFGGYANGQTEQTERTEG